LEALLARYGRQVYAMAYRMTGNDADAKDLSQEAFIRVWRSLDRLEPGAALDAWLHRVVTNLFIDMLRRRPKARIQSLDEPLATDEGAMARERADPETDVERIVLDRTMDRRVQEALLALREDLRMAIVLADVEGYAYEEIAEMMGVPIGTVKSRIHRARRALRDRLAPLRKESPGAP
jgi:RNA polymerase sigma-70 factor (ECF subfamily)